MRKKLEQLNSICAKVYVIRTINVDNDLLKQCQLEDDSFAATNLEVLPVVDNAAGFEVPTEDPVLPVVGSSRVNGTTDSTEVDDTPLKSVQVSNEVMDRYLEPAKKLRAELKRVALSDHDWWLKSFDMNGSGVVNLWCGECKKDCGGSNKDHTKAHIDNLFNNFRRLHIVNANHVRNFYVAKNVEFEDHP